MIRDKKSVIELFYRLHLRNILDQYIAILAFTSRPSDQRILASLR